MNEELEEALKNNLKEQKKIRKYKYTRPELFIIIEDFMIEYKLIGYGGMAINEMLPSEKKIYSDIDVPDYDFFSPTAEKHSIELSNRIYKLNQEVEVKSALFEGTYKIFVNSIPIVDISQLDNELFNSFHEFAVKKNNLYYAPYNFLRMSMHQELSRPMGDLSRWQKVYERLRLLNGSNPLLIKDCNVSETNILNDSENKIFDNLVQRLKSFIWLGDYTMFYYQHLFPNKYKTEQFPCLYILVEKEKEVWKKIKGIPYTIIKHSNKFIKFYQVFIQGHCMLYVILTDSCQSYNIIKDMNIASYDTILSIYYILSFMKIKELNNHKLLSYCFLLENIKQNGKKDKVMKRFKMPCIGIQKSYESLRQERDEKYKIYKKNGRYRHLFFRYTPNTKKMKKKIRFKKNKKYTRK
jgi:hypothetical protein